MQLLFKTWDNKQDQQTVLNRFIKISFFKVSTLAVIKSQ